jgi:CRP-like cAMP-binding protein
MLSLTETDSGFSSLSRLYKEQASNLFAEVTLQGEALSLPPCDNAFHYGMDASRIYLVKGGMLGSRCQGKRLITWDEGDVVLPDAGGHADEVSYYADASVLLVGYDTLKLMAELLASNDLMRRWLRLVMLQQALVMRLLAAHQEADSPATPGFVYFQPGDIIIRQGDEADSVFSLFEGAADVLVDKVVVGQIQEGEILGALAVLTESKRSATVRAKTRCSVVKVPRNQFKTLIRSNPSMIHKLLVDMANQIQKMNQQVVALSSG